MKGYSIVVLLLFAPLLLFSQKKNNNQPFDLTISEPISFDEIENIFRNIASRIEKNLGDKTNKNIELLSKLQVKLPKPTNYPRYYYTDKQYRNIVDRLEQIGNSQKDYYTIGVDSIIEQISKIRNLGEKEYAKVIFQEHFFNSIDSSTILDFFSRINTGFDIETFIKQVNAGLYPAIELAEASEANGNLFLQQEDLINGLTYYLTSLKAYEIIKSAKNIGDIQNKIAGLFLHINHTTSVKKAITHYLKAAEYFELAKDTADEYYAQLNAVNQLVWNSFPKIEVQDLFEEFYNHFNNKSISAFELINNAEKNRIENKRDEILSTAFRIINGHQLDNQLTFAVSILMGNYFGEKNEYDIANNFFENSLEVAMINYPNVDLGKIEESLGYVAWAYSKLRKDDSFKKCIGLQLELAKTDNDNYSKYRIKLIESNYLINVKEFNEGIDLVRNTIERVDHDSTLNYNKKVNLHVLGDQISYYLFQNLNNKDSANYYLEKYNSFLSSQIQTVNRLNEIESESDLATLENKNGDLKLDIDKKLLALNSLANKQILLSKKNDSLQKLKDILQSDVSKVKEDKKSLINDTGRLGATIDKQKGIIIENKKTIRQTTFWFLLITVSVLIIFAIVVYLKNRKVKKTRIELNGIAKGKIHNIKNNYSSIANLLRNKDFEKAIEYSSVSAYYFGLLVEKQDLESTKWTIANEIEVLEAFSEREQLVGKEIEIIKIFGTPEILCIKFLPEVFTTLLDNTIKHGFRNRKDKIIMKIELAKENNLLSAIISDNGTPPSGPYIRKDRPNRGLSILRNRIINEFKLKVWHWPYKDLFSVEKINNSGTVIKFKFPYVTTIENINSRG